MAYVCGTYKNVWRLDVIRNKISLTLVCKQRWNLLILYIRSIFVCTFFLLYFEMLSLVEEWKTNLMSLATLFHFLCAQNVSDINISIIRSLQLCWWITTPVALFSVRCVLEIWCGCFWVVPVLQAEAQLGVFQPATLLLIMDILMSEICWAHKRWYKISSDVKLVFHSSTITMMHGPINIS